MVNPLGYLPTDVVPPITWSSRVKKVTLMREARAPAAMVLGSSRSMIVGLAPLRDALGGDAFNAAVDSARAEEIDATVDFAFGELRWRPRALFIGVDPEMFHPSAPPDGRSFGVAALRDRMPLIMRARLASEVGASVLSLGTARTGATHLRRLRSGAPAESTLIERDGNLRYLLWERDRAAGIFRLDAREIVPSYLARFAGLDHIGAERAALFERAALRASSEGARVVLFVSPMHDTVRAALRASRGYDRTHGQTLAWLRALSTRVRNVTVLDYSDARSFGAQPEAFVDGAHIDADSAEYLGRALANALRTAP